MTIDGVTALIGVLTSTSVVLALREVFKIWNAKRRGDLTRTRDIVKSIADQRDDAQRMVQWSTREIGRLHRNLGRRDYALTSNGLDIPDDKGDRDPEPLPHGKKK